MDISSFKIDKFKYYSGGNGSKLCLKDSDEIHLIYQKLKKNSTLSR